MFLSLEFVAKAMNIQKRTLQIDLEAIGSSSDSVTAKSLLEIQALRYFLGLKPGQNSRSKYLSLPEAEKNLLRQNQEVIRRYEQVKKACVLQLDTEIAQLNCG